MLTGAEGLANMTIVQLIEIKLLFSSLRSPFDFKSGIFESDSGC